MPAESFYWPGGKLRQDGGIVIYNVNHLKVKNGQLDAAILAAKYCSSKKKKEARKFFCFWWIIYSPFKINFDEYDLITGVFFYRTIWFWCIAFRCCESAEVVCICAGSGRWSLSDRLRASRQNRAAQSDRSIWFDGGIFKLDYQLFNFAAQIGHLSYDQAIKAKMTKPRSKHCAGPFFQLMSYQLSLVDKNDIGGRPQGF